MSLRHASRAGHPEITQVDRGEQSAAYKGFEISITFQDSRRHSHCGAYCRTERPRAEAPCGGEFPGFSEVADVGIFQWHFAGFHSGRRNGFERERLRRRNDFLSSIRSEECAAGAVCLPLSNPMLAGPACSSGSAVAKLSADGTTLEYATYLPGCGVPAMALSPDGSAYAGVTVLPGAGGASLLHFTTSPSAPIALNQIYNAFSGDASAAVGGGLYTLGIAGFQPPSSNLASIPARICRMN